MFPTFTRLFKKFPLSGRWYLFVCFVAGLYFLLGRGQSDIIALVIASSCIIPLILLAFLVTLFQRRLSQNAVLKIFPHATAPLHPNEAIPIDFLLRNAPIPPLFEVTLELFFCSETQSRITITFSGASREHGVMGHLYLPHRGIWHLSEERWTMRDFFGLYRTTWSKKSAEVNQTVTIVPFPRTPSGIPLVSSSFREGDAISLPMAHAGDYYDIKRYHPSDGMNKLLWKLFAKSGELLARKPEESVSPEGQTVALCFAQRSDDTVSAAMASYLRIAEAADSEIIASCLGACEQPLVRSADALEKIQLETVFNIPEPLGNAFVKREIESFLDSAENILQHSALSNVLIFISENFFTSTLYAGYCKLLGEAIEKSGAQPIFCLIDSPHFTRRASQNTLSPTPLSYIQKLLLEDKKHAPKVVPYRKFLTDTCQQRDWTYYEGTAV